MAQTIAESNVRGTSVDLTQISCVFKSELKNAYFVMYMNSKIGRINVK